MLLRGLLLFLSQKVNIFRGLCPSFVAGSTVSVSDLIGVPEQGQIVTVRQRRYSVVVVLPSTLPPAPLGGQAAPQHLVTLNSIEDDALGESLQVVWELEPGARISCGTRMSNAP